MVMQGRREKSENGIDENNLTGNILLSIEWQGWNKISENDLLKKIVIFMYGNTRD